MTDFDGVPDPAVRLRVQRLAEQLDLDLDVDEEWRRLVARLEDERRPRMLPRLVLVAAGVLFLVFVARPIVVTGAQAAVRFVAERVDEAISSSLPGDAPPSTSTPVVPRASATSEPTTTTTYDDAHGAVAASDQYRSTIRAVHEQINEAVGYQRWNPEALHGAPELLESVIDEDPALTDEVRTAMELLRRAIAGPDKDAAIYAHRIIEDIERQRAGRTTG